MQCPATLHSNEPDFCEETTAQHGTLTLSRMSHSYSRNGCKYALLTRRVLGGNEGCISVLPILFGAICSEVSARILRPRAILRQGVGTLGNRSWGVSVQGQDFCGVAQLGFRRQKGRRGGSGSGEAGLCLEGDWATQRRLQRGRETSDLEVRGLSADSGARSHCHRCG